LFYNIGTWPPKDPDEIREHVDIQKFFLPEYLSATVESLLLSIKLNFNFLILLLFIEKHLTERHLAKLLQNIWANGHIGQQTFGFKTFDYQTFGQQE
jgi:hypothetical protein